MCVPKACEAHNLKSEFALVPLAITEGALIKLGDRGEAGFSSVSHSSAVLQLTHNVAAPAPPGFI